MVKNRHFCCKKKHWSSWKKMMMLSTALNTEPSNGSALCVCLIFLGKKQLAGFSKIENTTRAKMFSDRYCVLQDRLFRQHVWLQFQRPRTWLGKRSSLFHLGLYQLMPLNFMFNTSENSCFASRDCAHKKHGLSCSVCPDHCAHIYWGVHRKSTL